MRDRDYQAVNDASHANPDTERGGLYRATIGLVNAITHFTRRNRMGRPDELEALGLSALRIQHADNRRSGVSAMPDEDADYKRQVEEANQTLVDGLEAQVKVAERGDDVEENSWEPFLNQLKGLVADGELLDETRSEVEGFRDSLLGHASVLFQSRGRELDDALNTPVRDD
ncbi:hypothetical protein F4813DRAFT_302103 [Daldinia decipiens]|uniref:uncharacterized protein n=1 Tax=Daldinia decipiens TaxID=326647 RepID=UPI0020C1D71E|nr:uncharacterized protein F4813DRAFT_302103 [Daldinia decipiens]KAI1652695.1 hypothetical protein F4813DRAFT_302103 [Daldinia decipiens]